MAIGVKFYPTSHVESWKKSLCPIAKQRPSSQAAEQLERLRSYTALATTFM
jgi:hypothetical protein